MCGQAEQEHGSSRPFPGSSQCGSSLVERRQGAQVQPRRRNFPFAMLTAQHWRTSVILLLDHWRGQRMQHAVTSLRPTLHCSEVNREHNLQLIAVSHSGVQRQRKMLSFWTAYQLVLFEAGRYRLVQIAFRCGVTHCVNSLPEGALPNQLYCQGPNSCQHGHSPIV